jgi:hypothetical protein
MLAAVLSAAVAGTVFGGFSKERFRNPENIHSPAYFWMWNSKLEPEKLNAQLDDMRAHGMRSICIHPFPVDFRPNGVFDSSMSPDYLTEGYFRVFSNVVEHAARRLTATGRLATARRLTATGRSTAHSAACSERACHRKSHQHTCYSFPRFHNSLLLVI